MFQKYFDILVDIGFRGEGGDLSEDMNVGNLKK